MDLAHEVLQLGIPTWMVEIRHNASHSHVPPIRTLRKAFHFSRQWLWVWIVLSVRILSASPIRQQFQDNFWSRQPYEAMRSAGAVDTNSDVVAAEASLRDQKIHNAIVAFALWRNKASSPDRRCSPSRGHFRFGCCLAYSLARLQPDAN